MSSQSLRSSFLEFFQQHGHSIEKSAPLIPKDDPTLLFVNAGMVQFKNVFTQKETRPYTRAATSQKCVRAGGKHNDLENVGQTARHHTFFEMLGNFSFGDYFKEEAITLAWKFLTEVIKLDKQRLSVSVFAGDEHIPADIEAEKIWHEKIGVPKERIKRLGRADNFWQMGDTGPCGPCTEIHYDRGDIKVGFGNDDIDDRNVEIWNLVFMQYEQKADGTLSPLPAPCVDTGMGLERLSCVVNQLASNYDTDLLLPLVLKAASLSNKVYGASDSHDDMAMRVIADHARATAFLIADGLFPSNEGRGYVLRRIMRRAIRHGAQLGLDSVFFHLVCLEVVELMKEIYPELTDARAVIEKAVLQEEESFRRTLDRGLALFAQQTKNLKAGDSLSGIIVFRLHETYGFPPDLTQDLAKERQLNIEWESFHQAQKEHEEKSGQGLGLKGIDDVFIKLSERLGKTAFHNQSSMSQLKVLALLSDNHEVKDIKASEKGIIILDKSPFYGESGGQIGDTGLLSTKDIKARVYDTKKIAGLHIHLVEVLQGNIETSTVLEGHVDWERRQAIMRNHSATHLLHAALRKILGDHVVQKGSLVAPDRLRFDFAHFEAMTRIQLHTVENLVNHWILLNEEAKIQEMTMEEAKAYGALALFGEKYESKVRVLDMGSHSIELCGGTHCSRTGDIGSFRIISESPLAQGIRRIEAVSGEAALTFAQNQSAILTDLSHKLGIKASDLPLKIDQLLIQIKKSEADLKSQAASSLKTKAKEIAAAAKTIGTTRFVGEIVTITTDNNELRAYADFIRDALGSGVVALATQQDDNKCSLLIAVTKDLSSKLHAGKIVAQIAPIIDGKGGGRPDFAQAGGSKASAITQAIEKIKDLLKDTLG
ncbi:MAG: alanine--tRNA ligase [Myxococcales bacterium]|nr:alanine--tRNA ligase [Myxococcales bacterium]